MVAFLWTQTPAALTDVPVMHCLWVPRTHSSYIARVTHLERFQLGLANTCEAVCRGPPGALGPRVVRAPAVLGRSPLGEEAPGTLSWAAWGALTWPPVNPCGPGH